MTIFLLVVWINSMPILLDAYGDLEKCLAVAAVHNAKGDRNAVCPRIRVVAGSMESE